MTNTVFENVFGSRRVGRAAGHSVEPRKERAETLKATRKSVDEI